MNLPCVRVQIESSFSYEYLTGCELLKVHDSKSLGVSPLVDLSASETVSVKRIRLPDAISSQQPSESFGWSLRSSKKRTGFGGISIFDKNSMAGEDTVLMVDSTSSAITKLRRRSRVQSTPSAVRSINTRSYSLIGRKCALQSTVPTSPLRSKATEDKTPVPLRISPRRCAANNQGLQTGEFWRFLSTHLSVVCSNGCASKMSTEAQLSPSFCECEDLSQPYRSSSTKDLVHLQPIGMTPSDTESQVSNFQTLSKPVVSSRKRTQRNQVLSGKPIASLSRSQKATNSKPISSTSQNCKLTVNTAHGSLTVSHALDREQVARDEVRQLRKRFRNDPFEYLSAGFGASSTVRRDQLTQVVASIERHKMARRGGILARLAFFERAGDRIATLRERDRIDSSEPLSFRQHSNSTAWNGSSHRLYAKSRDKNDAATMQRSRNTQGGWGRPAKFAPAYTGSSFPIRDCFVSLCRVPINLGTKRVRLARRGATNWRPDKPCWHPTLNLEPLNLQVPANTLTIPSKILSPSQGSTLPSVTP